MFWWFLPVFFQSKRSMTGTLPFEKIKIIPDNHKHCVFGFIRKCQSLFKTNEAYYQIHKSIQYSILLFYYASIDSKILSDEEIDTLLSMFAEQNKFKELGPYSYDLLYASYRDGIGEKPFKKLCHDKKNLVCLIETKAGNVWGGYTSKGWRGTPKRQAQDDDKSFLFVIRSKDNHPSRIFNVLKTANALYNQDNGYCIFGSASCYGILGSGESGLCYNRAQYGDGHYERGPCDFYITGEGDFSIACVEVIHLQCTD